MSPSSLSIDIEYRRGLVLGHNTSISSRHLYNKVCLHMPDTTKDICTGYIYQYLHIHRSMAAEAIYMEPQTS